MAIINSFGELVESDALVQVHLPQNLIAHPAIHGLILAARASARDIVAVTASTRAAQELSDELRSFLGEDRVIEFPPWETLPHEKLSPKSDTISARIKALHQVRTMQEQPRILVTSVRGLLQPIASDLLTHGPIRLEIGGEIALTSLIERLSFFGFTRTDLVERRGEFAVRGGIVDFFPADQEHPIRADFFGDEIEELRFFMVGDQRTFQPVVGALEIFPCRELLIDDLVKEKAQGVAEKFPTVREIATKISEGISVEGMESLIAILKPDLQALTDFLPTPQDIFLVEGPRIHSRAIDLIETNKEFLAAAWSNAAQGGQTPVDLSADLAHGGFYSLEEITDRSERQEHRVRQLNPYSSGEMAHDLEISAISAVDFYRGNFDEVIADLRSWLGKGFLVYLSTEGEGTLARWHEILMEAQVPSQIMREVHTTPVRDVVHLIQSEIHHGFLAEKARVALVTEKDISGQHKSSKDQARLPSRRKKAVDPLELRLGDYIVHEMHGVGKYIELVQRTVGGVSREYIVIEYAPSKRGHPADRIYVPTDTLDQVTKYVGGEAPTLHKIGGADWQNAKRRARKAVKQIAADLIRLYAARMSAPGFAFSPDTPWQRELEAAFPYIETNDQLSTIEEVKRDMESAHPMDRIVCGDVGYGKTEIAIRAAFKAVQDGKQVAVLVPTTLLVQQHLSTFTERYTGFPIRVAGLSRFNTDKESNQILRDLKSGTVDIVIGTHRLLSKDVEFRDLGLLIIDEEQRFGVEHKEELKKARTNVDVLSMSATPIPRTLEMAITGIREMSNITTPPEERHPVLTYVGFHDDRQVAAAIRRELIRDGQIFYIHNRVESIDNVAERISKLVPEVRIRVAHGQMNEKLLEEVILAFWNREFDLLLCTTIIESGIDIPNANTLIVDRADTFGLSQLHQLRGRVGRGRERAYAYFLYPADKPLTEVAHDRLRTIATNTDLGSGMQVAMKDLEIRGAGNLLGGEQSGHIAEVGFDLYMRMVAEAVSEYKSGYFAEEESAVEECKVELPITAHLPADYVPSERLRLDLYRRIADAADESVLTELTAELQDRFGALPDVASNLFRVAEIRTLAKRYGLNELLMQAKFLKLAPVDLPESAQIRLHRLYPGSILKSATSTVLVARPQAARPDWLGGEAIGDTELLSWTVGVLEQLVAPLRQS